MRYPLATTLKERMRRYKYLLFFCLILLSCSPKKDVKYFIATDKDLLSNIGLGNGHWILGERKGDSLKLWYVGYNLMALYHEDYPSETILFKPGNGEHYAIKRIVGNKIIGDPMNLKPVSNLKEYGELRKEIRRIEIDKEYNDPLINEYHNSEWVTFYDERESILKNSDFREFDSLYRNCYDNFLIKQREINTKKQNFYDGLKSGSILINESTYREAIEDYSHGDLDREIFYFFITHKPELFYSNIDLSRMSSDISQQIGFNETQLDSMYCLLLPMKSRNPEKLYMFETRGNRTCQTNKGQ